MGTIPRAVAERILRDGGALRVSAEAKERFITAIEEYGRKLAVETVKISSHAGRKTVRGTDIGMAVDILS